MKKLLLLSMLVVLGCSEKRPQSEANPQTRFEKALKDNTYGKNDKAGKYYDIRGFRMYCETYGEGEPVLMIHGNGGDISNFVMQIGYFSRKYKVIVPDSRAQGKSIDKKDSLSYEMMADDLAELLHQMKIEKANVIGWSDGGIEALLLAKRHPGKVNKLAITGANIWPDATAIEPGEWANMQKSFHELEAKMKTRKPQTPADSLAYKLQKLMAGQPNLKPEDLASITAPTLVIGGDHDMIRPEHTIAIFRALPNAQLLILPNSGHATLVSFDTEFNEKIDSFFSNPFVKRKANERFF
ncbi:alpha/beta hydrolase [Flavobacterium sp. MAH-1]|uniref:Alpha/beta hydrolase n=1 Tax=Flavobacterium agri TaxID=2743471 RepID=A0A7Y9C566_9FLAO|nr:alpha/beta hydrolase [Flavobacterium agri]NUY80626.1 alpha/beta hydrolase [Flavobacterium agri]NYA70650.1 alpha/beta hydrolase [Flavobacterium agri]